MPVQIAKNPKKISTFINQNGKEITKEEFYQVRGFNLGRVGRAESGERTQKEKKTKN